MELRDKVQKALSKAFLLDHIFLDDEAGISGYIVSSQFQGVDALDRQRMISKVLHSSSAKLTRAELDRVLAIAPLTPAEFAAVETWK